MQIVGIPVDIEPPIHQPKHPSSARVEHRNIPPQPPAVRKELPLLRRRLRGIERTEVGSTPKGSAGAGEQQGSRTLGAHPPDGLPAEKEAAEATDPPALLEVGRLHVVDPAGVEIYWANRASPSGGQLDLDSNAACSTDGVRNENITWSVGTAPQGDYTVRVDYWSACGAAQTRYTVLIHSEGQTEIHRGTFTGTGDSGGLGSGTTITAFARATGPLPAPVLNRSTLDLPVGPTTK